MFPSSWEDPSGMKHMQQRDVLQLNAAVGTDIMQPKAKVLYDLSSVPPNEKWTAPGEAVIDHIQDLESRRERLRDLRLPRFRFVDFAPFMCRVGRRRRFKPRAGSFLGDLQNTDASEEVGTI